MGLLRGLNGAPKRTSMGPLEGPHKKKKVKQYLTRDLRGHEVAPYLGALTGTLRISIGQRAPSAPTLLRKPIGMAFFNIQVLLKNSKIPEFRSNQQSGLTEKL
jgi:hypothetical protein